MAVQFIDLASDQQALVKMLGRLGKLEAGVTPAIQMLKGGVSSNIMRIETGKEIFCLKQALPTLKVAKEWHAPIERVFAEIAWLEAAAQIVPEHVPDILGVDKQSGSFLMEFFPPEQNMCWKDLLLLGRVDTEVAAQLGHVLSLIHNETAGNSHIVDTFDTALNDQNFMAIRLDAYLLETGRQHPERRYFFQSLVDSFIQHKHALVHGDISPKNILTGSKGLIILDAECACYGDPAFDVAFLLNHLLLKAVVVPQAAASLSRAFSFFCTHYFAFVGWEPRQALECRVAQLLPALLLARVDGKSPVEYLNDAQRERVRQFAEQLLDAQFNTVSLIQSFWYREINQ